jgi:hypothetical protein
VLRKHSSEHCIATLTVASYRHTVLAIAKRCIAPQDGQFNGQRPEHISQVWRDIAWQAAHNVRTLTSLYALDQSYPSQLQPELIGRYMALSEHWHCWLQLERLQRKQLERQTPRQRPKPDPKPDPKLDGTKFLR